MLYVGLVNLLFLLRYVLARSRGLRKQVYFLVLASLFVFSAFRYQVGCDWLGYYNQYLVAGALNLSLIAERPEPIWWAILWWINDMGLPYPVANIPSSAIFFFGVHVLAKRQPDPLAFLVLLFPFLILNLPMSGIRQGAAAGVLCLVFVSFIDRRPILTAFWVLVAAGVHSSALVFLVLSPIATVRYTRTRLVVAAIAGVPGLFLLASGDTAALAVDRYVGTGVDAAGAVFRVGMLGVSALYFYLFLSKKWKRTWPQDYSLLSIGVLGMVLCVSILPFSSVISDRLAYYLIPIQAVMFGRIPYLPFRSDAALHAALPYFGLLFVFIVWTQLSSIFSICYIPYQTWLFGFPE